MVTALVLTACVNNNSSRVLIISELAKLQAEAAGFIDLETTLEHLGLIELSAQPLTEGGKLYGVPMPVGEDTYPVFEPAGPFSAIVIVRGDTITGVMEWQNWCVHPCQHCEVSAYELSPQEIN
jgi:hypothetical protein